MSHYNDFKTTIKDKDALLAAIARCKFKGHVITRGMIEVHDTPTKINGYYNDDRKAHIIIRKQNFGGYGDMGFLKNADESYTIVQDDLDGNDIWRGELQTYYNVEKSKAEFAAKGIEVEETKDEKGRIQLRAKFNTSQVGGSRIKVGR